MSYYEFTIEIPDTFRDKLIKRLADAGCLGVIEQDEAITAYFPETADISAITADLSLLNTLLEKSGQARGLFFSHGLIPEQDWNESWKKGFLPIDVGQRFTILPPWEKRYESRINLVIDPGMAFGTGHHETTRSCLVLMEKYSDASPKGRFLDLGTGTGLLAIAASKLGFREVVAVDTDPLSIEAVQLNMKLNHVANIELLEGSIANVDGGFDVIAANIISGVLVRFAPDIASRLSPAGRAILSGILAEQADEVIAACELSGMTVRELFPDGKWVSIVAGR
jgi:ribosomal protein L11 methyltransferase